MSAPEDRDRDGIFTSRKLTAIYEMESPFDEMTDGRMKARDDHAVNRDDLGIWTSEDAILMLNRAWSADINADFWSHTLPGEQ